MKQLIARIDDDLHRRIKERAAREGRSLNALVSEVLADAVADRSPRQRFRERLRAAGLLDEVRTPDDAPSMDEITAMTRGAGSVFSEMLEEIRRPR